MNCGLMQDYTFGSSQSCLCNRVRVTKCETENFYVNGNVIKTQNTEMHKMGL